MNQFKKVLGIILGIASLVVLAVLVIIAFNSNYNFTSNSTMLDIFSNITRYASPALVGLAAIWYVSDKNLLIFILTVIFVALCLFIYCVPSTFFDFLQSIFG